MLDESEVVELFVILGTSMINQRFVTVRIIVDLEANVAVVMWMKNMKDAVLVEILR